MRVVSQDGLQGIFDFPYDKCIVSIYNDMKTIKLCPIGEPDSEYKVARYSTKEKALKVMEMLRNTYLSRMELDGGYDMVHGCYVQPNYWILPKVFQFPKDEDVEV